ncbi:MAG: methyltransferase domain-containing protein [candidate division WOR-3 bacterium]
MKTATEIEQYFLKLNLNEESYRYLKYHSKRYVLLLDIVRHLRTLFPENIKIMDVGPSFFTEILQKNFPEDQIFTLGYDAIASRGGHFPIGVNYNKNNHFVFDLNNSQDQKQWIKVPMCDIIILAEVIEHLYTSPILVLKFIDSFLKSGGFLVIQTPNAASLLKRITLLIGRNPYEMIREDMLNPGHYHEYTKNELFTIAQKIGYNVYWFKYSNYFNRLSKIEKIYGFVQKFTLPQLKDGMSLILQKP